MFITIIPIFFGDISCIFFKTQQQLTILVVGVWLNRPIGAYGPNRYKHCTGAYGPNRYKHCTGTCQTIIVRKLQNRNSPINTRHRNCAVQTEQFHLKSNLITYQYKAIYFCLPLTKRPPHAHPCNVVFNLKSPLGDTKPNNFRPIFFFLR